MSYAADADRILAALRGLDAPASAQAIAHRAFDYQRRCALGFDSTARAEEILRDFRSSGLAIAYGVGSSRLWGPPGRPPR